MALSSHFYCNYCLYEIDIVMNSKLVLWGTDAKDEKILIALELLAEENKVKILTFPDKIVIDDFYDKMRNDWRVGKEVELVEGYIEEIRDLTASETLLPDHIKVERTDLIERKQLEWHVMVLSSKMYAQFKSELDSIKEKVEGLDAFDNAQWEGLKTFWNKVQNQVRDGILTRNYANDLRKGTDEIFDKLKVLRKSLDDEYRSKAKENYDWFSKKLDEVEGKIEEGLKLSGVFDELKDLQKKFHNTKFTREFRDKVWSRIDDSFKSVKEKKYGKNATNESSALARINNRYEGLIKAIKRSEFSRDKEIKDLEFEKRRIQNTDGQLEAQIREAKIKMINQRLKFKEDKLKEMYATRDQLDSKMVKLKEKEKLDEIRKEKEAAAKAKIQASVKQTKETMDDETKEKLAAAAEEINEAKKKKGKGKKKDFVDKVMDTVDEVREMIEEKVDDAIISAKAAAVVISEKVSERAEPLAEKGKEIVDDLTTKAEEKVKEVKEVLSSSKDDKVEDAEVVDGEDKKEKGFFDKAMDAVESIKETVSEAVDDVVEKMEPYTEKGKEIVDDLTAKASDVVDDVKEKASDMANDVKDVADNVSDNAENIKDAADDVLELDDLPPKDA